MRVSRRSKAPRLLATPGALRAQALIIVAMLQVGVVAAAASSGSPAPVALDAAGVVEAPRPGPVDLALAFADRTPSLTTRPTAKPTPRPQVRPSPSAVGRATPVARPAKRWIPTGTGMWTYQWAETEGGDTARIVRRARMVGLTHLYVRTGTRAGGFDGAPVLRELLPATKGTGIKVVAWDFPQLSNPVGDARRLAAAARFTVPGAPRVAAVAPDIETGSEGTKLTARAVETYLRTLRSLLPNDVAIIGVVPWPSEKRAGHYPYGSVARYSDAVAPMAYWVNRDPGTVTMQSIKRLHVFGRPVLPVGQAYDPRIDVPSLKWGAPSKAQVDEFFHTAARYGAPGASLWVWQFAKLDHWKSLQGAAHLYD
jgi:hypothetical protein